MKNKISNKLTYKKAVITLFLSYIITLLFTLNKNLKIEKKTFFHIFINDDSLICLLLFILLFIFIKDIDLKTLMDFEKRENRIINIFSFVFSIINTIGIEAFRNSINKYYIILFVSIIFISFIVFNFFIRIFYFKTKDINFEQSKFPNKKFITKKFLKIFIPIFTIRIIFFVIFFPGNFTWDSMYCVKEGIGVLPLSNSHPYLYIYTVGVFGKLGLKYFSSVGIGIGIFNFINLIFTSIVYSLLLYKLFEFEFNKKLKLALYIYFCINPYFIVYSFTLYKDVVLGNFMLLFILVMIEMIYNPKAFFSKNISIIYFLISIFGVYMLHRKAIIYVIVGIVSLLFSTHKKYRLKTLTYIFISIIFCLSLNGILKNILNPLESSMKYDYLSTRFQQLASVVKYHPETFSDNELKLCDKIFGLERIKNDFDPHCADPIKNHIKNDDFKDLKNDFFKLWLKMYLKHPKTNIDAILNLSLSYFYPYNSREDMWIGDYYENMYEKETDWFTYKTYDIPSNLYLKEKYGYFDKDWKQATNFKEIHKLNKVTKHIIYSIASYPVISSFLKAGFATWLLILSFGYSILKRNKKIMPLIYLCLSIVFTCIYSPIVNYYRYSYLIFITVPILIPFLFINNFKKE
ncbi:DUF6020 family protein [Eubacteriales bacterium KG127]